jgi:hypothetical protein
VPRISLDLWRAAADLARMEVQAQAALSILTMTVQGAHDALQRAQRSPVPADAPASAHADVILQLSAAAQSLITPSSS